jgi:glycosyltransferase involved in cell wall biosynthesis
MTKVLHIITRLDRGGSAQNTLLTCQRLSRRYEMVLVHGLSKESRMTPEERQTVDAQVRSAEEGGVRFVAVPSLVRRIDPFKDLWAFFTILGLLRKERPDIVHTHSYKAGILGCWAARMAGVRRLVHTPHGHVFYGHFSPIASRLFMLIERLTTPLMDRMVTLTEGEKRDYIAFSVCTPEKIVTIHSGVDVGLFGAGNVDPVEKRRSLGIDSKASVVGTVGWLLPIKGSMHLLRAMDRVWRKSPDTVLVFVGKGDLEIALKEEARKMGVARRVMFLGWREDVHEIMPVLDVFVLPSLNEGMGRVLVEAMAAGRPIVATSVGGIPDLVRDGENGFLVEPGDTEGLAQKISRLLDQKDMRKAMGERGRLIAHEFSVERMVEKIDMLYASLSVGSEEKG